MIEPAELFDMYWSPEREEEHRRKMAAEARETMEKRWALPGVADAKRPCQWQSGKYGRPLRGD